MLRHFARMHEGAKLYREAERCLREFKLNDPWYIKPTEKDGRGWGATEAIRGALCHWIEVEGGKIKNYQIIAPTTWNVGPRAADEERGPIEEALIGTPIADRARSGGGWSCLSLVQFVPRLHRSRPRRADGRRTCTIPHGLIPNRRSIRKDLMRQRLVGLSSPASQGRKARPWRPIRGIC